MRALALLSQKVYVMSIAALQRAAPEETLALFQVMNFEGTDRMTFSGVTQRKTYSMRQSMVNAFNADDLGAVSLQTLWILPKPSTALSDIDIDESLPPVSPEEHKENTKRLLDLWHVSSSHKNLLGSVNSLTDNILRYWEGIDKEFSSALSIDSGLDITVAETTSEYTTGDNVEPCPKDEPSSGKTSFLYSPGSFSLSSISNLLTRYHVTITVAEYLSIKCDSNGIMMYGDATGTLSVASKVNETAATKLSCNIRESIMFPGTAPRDFSGVVNVSSLGVNNKHIRSSEANGLFFITSQPGNTLESVALEYSSSLLGGKLKPPVYMVSACNAVIVSGGRDSELNPTTVTSGEMSVHVSFTYTFVNTCKDRDISDLSVDIPLPQCEEVVTCVTDGRGKIFAKYDKPKNLLFARIPKLKKGSELNLTADITVFFYL